MQHNLATNHWTM